MNLTGTVVSVSLSTQVEKQAGGFYEAWELVFRDGSNKIQSIAKPVQGLKYNAELKKALSELSPGDAFTCVMEKNDKGFNDVKAIMKGEFQTELPSGGNVAKANTQTGRVTGSNYETPAERAENRAKIVRQSSINYAIQLLKTEKVTPSVEDVLKVAAQFESFVNSVSEEKEVE